MPDQESFRYDQEFKAAFRQLEADIGNFKSLRVAGGVAVPDLLTDLQGLAVKLAFTFKKAELTPNAEDGENTEKIQEEFFQYLTEQASPAVGRLPSETPELFNSLLVFNQSRLLRPDSQAQTALVTAAKTALERLQLTGNPDIAASAGATLAEIAAKPELMNNPNSEDLYKKWEDPLGSEEYLTISDLVNGNTGKGVNSVLKQSDWVSVQTGGASEASKKYPQLLRVLNEAAREVTHFDENNPERKLEAKQESALRVWLKNLADLQVDVRAESVGTPPDLVKQTRKDKLLEQIGVAREIINRILHENNVIKTYRDSGRRGLLRPSTKDIQKEVYGEMMVFLAELGSDIDEIEAYGLKLATVTPGQNIREVLSQAEIARVMRFKEKITRLQTKYIRMARAAQGDLTAAETELIQKFLYETNNYQVWVDRILGEVQDQSENFAGEDLNDALEFPPQGTPEAWTAEFQRLYKMDGTPNKIKFRKFVEYRIYALEKAEGDYESQEIFSKHQDGKIYAGLRDFIKRLADTDPDQYNLPAAGFSNLGAAKEYLQKRIEIIDLMGPHGVSALMTANIMELTNKYPQYDISFLQYFVGTSRIDPAHPERSRYMHSDIVKDIVLQIEGYLTEDPDFGGLKNWQEGDFLTRGLFSFGGKKWMTREGDFHKLMSQRLKAEVFDDQGDGTYTWGVRTLTNQEVEAIIRIAYTCGTLTGIRARFFMDYYAVGISPPPFFELEQMFQSYPLAKELNTASKRVMEIPHVVQGGEVSTEWLLQMARKTGIVNEVCEYRRLYNKTTPNPDPNTIGEEVFDWIRNDMDWIPEDEWKEGVVTKEVSPGSGDFERVGMSDGYVRFRNLLQSIAISEAKARWLKSHHKHMMLTDARGVDIHDPDRSHHYHGELFMAGIYKSQYELLMGQTELDDPDGGFFAKKGTQLGAHWRETLAATNKLLEAIHAAPPKLEPGAGRINEAIDAITADLQKCFSFTSPMKQQQELINWYYVAELFEIRLQILIAAFIEAGFKPTELPVEEWYEKVLEPLLPQDIEKTLIDSIKKALNTSGQLLTGLRDWRGRLYKFKDAYNSSKPVAGLKQYLFSLIPDRPEAKPSAIGMIPRMAYLATGYEGFIPDDEYKAFATSHGGILQAYDRFRFANSDYKEYMDLKKRYETRGEAVNHVFLHAEGGHSGAAKAEQEKEIAESKASAAASQKKSH